MSHLEGKKKRTKEEVLATLKERPWMDHASRNCNDHIYNPNNNFSFFGVQILRVTFGIECGLLPFVECP